MGASMTLASLLLLLVSAVSASHFRGGTISWRRDSSQARTVHATVVMHFFTGGIFPRTQDVRLNWGDGSRNSPSRQASFLNGTWDATGQVRTIVYHEAHEYPALTQYTAYIESNARQHAIINGPDRSYRIETGISLANSKCLSSPAGIIPGVTFLGLGPKSRFQIGASTAAAQALSYTWYPDSYLLLNPPIAPAGPEATLFPAIPSNDGAIVQWDTSSGQAGSLYAVSVQADLVGIPGCHSVWDVTVQLEAGSVPQCESGSGSYSFYTSDVNAEIVLVASNEDGSLLNAALIGEAPPGVSFSSFDSTSEVTMTWAAPVAGSYAFAVQFCSRMGLCGACSVSLNVNNALPRIQVSSTASVSESGSYTFTTLAENTSQDSGSVVRVDSVTSSVDGDLRQYGCATHLELTRGGIYNCTYTSPSASGSEENVISVQVVSVGTEIESVASSSVTALYPETSSTAITSATSTTSTSRFEVTAAGGSAFATTTPAPVCGSLGTTRCTSDTDCGAVHQPGLCTANGFCQCGVGYAGVGTILDPVACEFACSLDPVPDAVASLREPTLDSFAEDGNLVVRVSVNPYLKQRPTTIAMLHPITGERCGILPERIGFCELTQETNPQTCQTDYEWKRAWQDAVFGSGCFIELPNVTETGPGFTVYSRQFRTVFEVGLSGEAPFGLNAQRSEASIERTLRREYTFTVAETVKLESEEFQTVADGRIRYRLVELDVQPREKEVVAIVQTRVIQGGSVSPLRLNMTESIGLPGLVRNVIQGSCAPSADGFCNQFHRITFALDPCAVNGMMVLHAGLQCDETGVVSDPVDCGFGNVPVGNVYTLGNLFLQYDACPRSTSYGIDLGQSYLRLYADSARTNAISSPPTISTSLFGRVSLRALARSRFSSATLQSLHLMRRQGSTTQDLGDQLSSNFVQLISSQTSTDQLNPRFDFNVLLTPDMFSVTQLYFWRATVDFVLLETGNLTLRNLRERQVVYMALAHPRALPGKEEDVRSALFTVRNAPVQEEDIQLPPEGQAQGSASLSMGLLVGASVGGVALVAVAICLTVYVWRRAQRRKAMDLTEARIRAM